MIVSDVISLIENLMSFENVELFNKEEMPEPFSFKMGAKLAINVDTFDVFDPESTKLLLFSQSEFEDYNEFKDKFNTFFNQEEGDKSSIESAITVLKVGGLKIKENSFAKRPLAYLMQDYSHTTKEDTFFENKNNCYL